jgi:hypothetical protein
MRRTIVPLMLALLLAGALADDARAVAAAGDPAPNFTKNQLDSPSFGLTTPRSLTDYLGKVVVLFVMGYS